MKECGRQNFMEEVLQLNDLPKQIHYCNSHDNGGGDGDDDEQWVTSYCISTWCVHMLYDVLK